PISLDAIEQLQLVVSPYDVRQGGFTGGGINAVTRSGSNEFHGSLFGSKRDQDYIGDGPADRPISEFDQDQYGGRLGGPILRDRLFFFVSGEINRREAPTGVAADGSASTQFRNSADAQRLRDQLIATYGYDPGGLGDFPGVTDSDLALVKLDWTANASNLVTLRHNYVDAVRDVIANRSSSQFRFPTSIYTIADETNSTVAQLNSVLGPNTFNEARIGFQTIRDIRDTPVIFPKVEIGGTGPRNGEFRLGTERFSGANALDQDVLELTDDFTWLRGNHTLTFGTHNQFFEFSNLFMSEAYGYYYFPTLEAFEAGIASEYRITFANGADPRRPTEFEVRQYGLYASDTWRVNDRLTLTLGLRGDMPDFVDTPSFNADVLAAIGHNTAETASEDVVVSPRVGFNWDPTGSGRQQVRGGVGIFAGRTPYVWISNAYGNTGVEQTALSSFGAIPFNPDPFNQPHVGAAGSTISVDLLDPGFEFPQVLRATLGYDRELPWRLRGTAELLWSQTQEDIFYLNVNRRQVGTSPLDGRPTFAQIDTATVRDAILLTNTGKGEEMVASLQLSRPLTRGVTLSGAYAYMDAESAMDGTSSRAISNWQFRPTPGDIFQDDVATSLFEVRHRFNLASSYAFDTGPVGHTVGLYYNVQSGRPYSLLVGGDPNRDGYTSNDLLFVPGAADAIILQNSSGAVIPYEVFADFLRSAGVDPTAGAIVARNGSREPWSRLLDFHYDVGLPIRRVDTRVSLDIFNLLNLIDSDEGVVDFVNFQTYTPVTYRGQDAATGKPIYRESFNGALEPGRQFSLADTRSRWQARLGLRLTF
ncbi:MAG TPA: TonB-dependent receptor, partial [Thermoanaerobaculia bacterium]|nr:TonB-dependent receptor [Thermoanaerobaculia bacterium]